VRRAIRWTRIDQSDGASEILTIVRLNVWMVEVHAGPGVGENFVGLYDLDGEAFEAGSCPLGSCLEVADASEVPAEVVTMIETDWARSRMRRDKIRVAP
jgi:hypothetical protein